VKVVRIFLSTPSDVDLERVQVQHLVRDVNETLQFLDPARELRIEVVYHETHAFPDVGSPQAVIDRQIPVDYDIYLGIMWKRAGTPTPTAPSGTIHEFEQAYVHATEHGWPIVMFFFCDDHIDMPREVEEVEQLARVVAFRRKLDSIGYTVGYGDRETFRDALRPRLLRAIADVLTSDRHGTSRGSAVATERVPPEQEARLRSLAERYNEIRRTMPSGPARTSEMQKAYNAMVEIASDVRPLLGDLVESSSPGERLAAIAVLRAFPQVERVSWLAERLDNPNVEAPFVGYQAAVALSQATRTLGADHPGEVTAAVSRALDLARQLPSDPDRIVVLERASDELTRLSRAATR
jgi:hypothetical protein